MVCLKMNNNEINCIKPSRRKGTIALMGSSYVSLALLIVKGIFLVPLYLRYIDARLYGAWLATGGIMAYFGLLQFGMSGVLVQRVAAAYGERNFERLGFMLGSGLPIGLALSCLPIILGVPLAPWIPKIVHVSGIAAAQIRTAFILAVFGTSLMIAMYIVAGILIALQQQLIHGIILIASDILGIACIIVLLMSGYGILAIPAGTVVWAMVSAFGEGLYLLWFMKSKLPDVKIQFRKKELKDLSIHSAWQFCSSSASTVARQSDNLIVAVLMDPSYCVILSLTNRASETLSRFVMFFVGAFSPGFSHLHGENDLKKFKRLALLLFKVTSFLGAGVMGSYLFLNDKFVNLWVGPKFFGGFVLTGLFYIYGFFLILVTFFYNTIFSKGEIITSARANIAEALLRIPLSFALVKFLGIKGVVVAAILAILPTAFWIQAKKAVKIFNLSTGDVLRGSWIIASQVFSSIIIGIILRSFWSPSGIVEFVLFACLYLASVCFVFMLLDKELLFMLKDRIDRFFKRCTKIEEIEMGLDAKKFY